MDEIWKTIAGFGDNYQISNFGRVRSLPKFRICGHCGSKPQRLPERIMKTHTIKGGYQALQLRHEKMCKKVLVHRLVLLTFVGPCPTGMEGCHRDGNPKNNHLTNLRWDTPKENCKERGNGGVAKLTEKEVIEARKEYALGVRLVDLSRKYKLSQASMHAIVHRKNWKHI